MIFLWLVRNQKEEETKKKLELLENGCKAESKMKKKEDYLGFFVFDLGIMDRKQQESFSDFYNKLDLC